jgi:hypothetical protein
MWGIRHWRWHLDKVFVKINGERHHLWRAVDHEGEILESYVTKKRNKSAALKSGMAEPRRSSLTGCDHTLRRCGNWAI